MSAVNGSSPFCLRKLASRFLLLVLTIMIGGLPSVAVQGFAWVSMVAKSPGKSATEAAFFSPPCEYCNLARAIQPDQDDGDLPAGSDKRTLLLGPVSAGEMQKEPRALPVVSWFGPREEESLRDLLEEGPSIPPPETALQTV